MNVFTSVVLFANDCGASTSGMMSNNDIRTAFFDFEIDVNFAPPRFPHCKHILEINDIDMGKSPT